MTTPEDPQSALSATQTAEDPLPGVPQSDGSRWALYARSEGATRRQISPGYKPQPFDSNEKQLDVLRQLVAARGGVIAGEYTDIGAAGGPGRAELLTAAVAGECTRIATVDLNRLLRTLDEGGAFLRDLLDCGVGLTLAVGPSGDLEPGGHDLGPAKLKMMLATAGAFSRHEKELAKRLVEERRRRRGQG